MSFEDDYARFQITEEMRIGFSLLEHGFTNKQYFEAAITNINLVMDSAKNGKKEKK